MSIATGITSFGDLPKDYDGLVGLFMLRPIHDEAELDNATELIDLMAGYDLTYDQEEYLDVLSDLVEKHEQEIDNYNPDVDSVDLLAFLLDENGMSASDLGKLLGSRELGTRILNRERSLSKEHIRRVCERFHLSSDLFILQ